MNFNANILFTSPTKVYYGYNSIGLVGVEAKNNNIKKALIVSDKGVNNAGIAEPLLKTLEITGVKYVIFDDVPEDPGTSIVDKGVETLKNTNCDGVIILGGGSPLCVGKAIALIATNGGSIASYEGIEKHKVHPLKVLAIPTTAGSGSEVSSVFIIKDESSNRKMVIGGYDCHPTVAILDPLLLRTLPTRQFIISGIDALTHAVEATWTNQCSFLTDAIAYEAIRLIMKNLPTAAYTDNLEAKGKQLFGSTLANIACGNAKLGLVHSMALPIETYGIAHGLATGIFLPYVMEYNLPVCSQKYAKILDVIGEDKSNMTEIERATAAIDSVKQLLIKLDFTDRLDEKQIPKTKVRELSKAAANLVQTRLNIRRSTENNLANLYELSYRGWRKNQP